MQRQVLPPAKDLEQLRNSLQLALDKIIQELNATSTVDAKGQRITNLGQPSSRADAISLGYLNAQLDKIQQQIKNLNTASDFKLPSVVKAILDVGGVGILLLAGVDDPTGTTAPAGSLYLDSNGKLWQNVDGTSGGWFEVDGDDLVGKTLSLDSTSSFLKLYKSGALKFHIDQNGNIVLSGAITAVGSSSIQGSGFNPSLILYDSAGTEVFRVNDSGLVQGINISLNAGTQSYITGLTASRPLKLDNTNKIVVPTTVLTGTNTLVEDITPTYSSTIPDPVDTTGMTGDALAIANVLNTLLGALTSGGTIVKDISKTTKVIDVLDGIVTSLS